MNRVTILGSGTVVPSLLRSSCSVLIEYGESKIVFDLGAGTMRRLLEAGVAVSEVTHLLFSHLHPDHTGEFVSFLFATKYPETYRRRTPIRVIGARGLLEFYEKLKAVYGEWIILEHGLMRITELSASGPDRLRLENFEIFSLPVNHIASSIGYRVQLPGGYCVVYSGDTDGCGNLIELAKGADLFICESALPDEQKVKGHLTPSLAGEIASHAGVRKLVLTHFYPECDAADMEGQCRKNYSGPLVLARDLLSFDIPS
ncbi:MAG TPA: MBL fold metallo-hydrolase [Syntrophales bacterium]|nr:MBL fold metallo-hydrolase [Syntrophales bacterium]HPI56403.1 MBL fold metallo-hydrolase [Syntrophales bacterium]HPN24210.1 MBL fold metallo-hydrolase [Syntrophales bacterium]HQM28563.1 MBL fold metallo-hydrolase [Syntrophales bacterium]